MRYVWIERLCGASFMVAGAAKVFNVGEDAEGVLAEMARANAESHLAGISDLLAGNARISVLFVAAAMLLSGLAQVLGHPAARWAALGQFVMILGFVTLLHRGFPEIFLLDGLYGLVLAYLLLAAPTRQVAA